MAFGLGALAAGCESKFEGAPTGTGGGVSTNIGGDTLGPAGAAGAESGADGGVTGAGGAGAAGETVGGAAVGGGAGEGGVSGPEPDPSPVPLEGLALWLAADRGITLADGIVAIWKDQSGRSNDAKQLDLRARPSYSRTAINGKPAVLFNGVNQFFDLPGGFEDFTRGVSVFTVRQDNPVPTCAAAIELSTGAEWNDLFFGQLMGTISYEVYDTNLTGSSALDFGAPELSVAVHGLNKRVRFRHNGQSFGEGRADLPANERREQCFVGKSLYQACTTFSGAISEILLYERAVSDPELNQIEAYLKERWGCCDP